MNPDQIEALAARLREARTQGGPSALSQACAGELAARRPLPLEAAAWVVAREAGPGGSLSLGAAAASLAAQLLDLAARPACLACGACCRVSSPTLYEQDLALVEAGDLPRASLYTLRAGERVFSARLGRALNLEQDLVKLAENGGACGFLHEGRCGVYASRPLQCRHLECWSGRHAGQLEDAPRLERRHLFAGRATALALIQEYEIKLPAAQLDRLLEEARQDEKALERARELARLDLVLRQGVVERHGLAPEDLPLLWGRPLWRVARAYCLEISAKNL